MVTKINEITASGSLVKITYDLGSVDSNFTTDESISDVKFTLSKEERKIDGFPEETQECFSNHLGLWMVEPMWMKQAITMIKSGTWKPIADGHEDNKNNKKRSFAVSRGTAIIPIFGPMMKFESKFGGSSTLVVRKQIRDAANDSRINAILLHIDSPGGHVAGTKELADDVVSANAKKPVFAHIDDLGASAALWVASQARQIFANTMAQVGSIGVFAVVEDASEAFEKAGIKVHVISTGKFKGEFVDGTEITKAQLEEAQKRIDGINEHFLDAIKIGRNLDDKKLKEIADGRIFDAAKAKELGLIDGVQSLDMTLEHIAVEKKMSKIPNLQRVNALINLAEIEA